MTAHKEVFGVKFAQASLEQILPRQIQQTPVIPMESRELGATRNLFLNNYDLSW